MKRILILTAGFGDGHNAAARNLREALEQLDPGADVILADLYERSYKRLNHLAKKAYLGAVRYAPSLWAGFFKLVDRTPWLADGRGLGGLSRCLGELLERLQPDCVISTYPTYAQLINNLYAHHCEKPFRLFTVVTDSGSINSIWYRSRSDRYFVTDETTAAVLRQVGVPAADIHALGFPVSPLFAEPPVKLVSAPAPGEPFRILYLINTGKKKAGKALDRLLEIPDVELTVTVGRHAELKEKLARRARQYGRRLQLLGWTQHMPRLLMSSHLVIGKAGGASVQEAIAAACPMVINQVIPGQEDGNARLIRELGMGVVAEKNREAAQWVRRAMADDGALWRRWREQAQKVARPDAALRIARLVLDECERASQPHRPEKYPRLPNPAPILTPQLAAHGRAPSPVTPLLCDLHIHSNYSDGKLTVPELIDFYGTRGFDCICITDHWTDPRRLIGKLSRLTPYTLSYDQIDEYFEVISAEARRAWRKYGMVVLTGLEFNKDGATSKSSAHLLGVGLKAPISPRLDLLETIANIHAQSGLAIASHPHVMKSEWAKNTLHLWENQKTFAPVIDAWEIANRNNLFAPVSQQRLPFVANSDFHKPKHIFSWKTLLHCERDPEAIKECIRRNEHVSITLYRGTEYSPVAANPRVRQPILGLRLPDWTEEKPAPALPRVA